MGHGYGTVILLQLSVGRESYADLNIQAEQILDNLGVKGVDIASGPLSKGCDEHAPCNLLQGRSENIPDNSLSQMQSGCRNIAIKQQPNGPSECA